MDQLDPWPLARTMPITNKNFLFINSVNYKYETDYCNKATTAKNKNNYFLVKIITSHITQITAAMPSRQSPLPVLN
jgi:hypothetical protein